MCIIGDDSFAPPEVVSGTAAVAPEVASTDGTASGVAIWVLVVLLLVGAGDADDGGPEVDELLLLFTIAEAGGVAPGIRL